MLSIRDVQCVRYSAKSASAMSRSVFGGKYGCMGGRLTGSFSVKIGRLLGGKRSVCGYVIDSAVLGCMPLMSGYAKA